MIQRRDVSALEFVRKGHDNRWTLGFPLGIRLLCQVVVVSDVVTKQVLIYCEGNLRSPFIAEKDSNLATQKLHYESALIFASTWRIPMLCTVDMLTSLVPRESLAAISTAWNKVLFSQLEFRFKSQGVLFDALDFQ
jgi:hypothetical protein